MSSWKPRLLRAVLDAMYVGRVHRWPSRPWAGVGAILMLHRVRPPADTSAFAPNRILEVTPEFLERAILLVRALGYEIVSLDEATRRLEARAFGQPFVCFTLDDGYIDNYQYALPVFERLEAPFAVYVATHMPEGEARLWWQHLERIVLHREHVSFRVGDQTLSFKTASVADKYRAFGEVYEVLSSAPEPLQQQAVSDMLERHREDAGELCRSEAMSWEQIAALSQHPLGTIGAHTRTHRALSKLSEQQVQEEADGSRQDIAARLGVAPRHFSYPYGHPEAAGPREFDLIRELGFATATTTRKGVLSPDHGGCLHALPRLSLNGDYQDTRYLDVLLSGAPFAALGAWSRVASSIRARA